MNDTTLQDLIDRTLAYADHPLDGLDETEEKRVINDINAGLAELWRLLVQNHRQTIMKTTTISIVGDTETYSLPSDFYEIVKVWWIGNNRRFKMRRYNLDEADGLMKPIRAGTVEVWYAPRYTRLANKDDHVPGVVQEGWEDYAAFFAAERIIGLEEGDIQWVAMNRERIKQEVIDSAQPDDEGDPEAIGDYTNRWDGTMTRIFRAVGDVRELRYRLMNGKLYFIEVDAI